MKGRIFNTDQIRAIQSGKMTQFMQKVKRQPEPPRAIYSDGDSIPIVNEQGQVRYNWRTEKYYPTIYQDAGLYCDESPFGKVGDVIYCRETWARYQTVNHRRRINGAAFGEVSDGAFAYKADGFDSAADLKAYIRQMSDVGLEAVEVEYNRFQPPNIMPREAARMFMRITNIRVMRVQELSEYDAFLQGFGVKCECISPVVPGACENCMNTGYSYPPLMELQGMMPEVWNANKYHWILDFTLTDKIGEK